MTKEQPSTVEVYQVLCEIRDLMKSQDATMMHILALTELRLKGAMRNQPANGAGIASDADLDGPRGDPTVSAKDPRDWSGEPMKGRKFSECPPEYLDLLAERFDYFAGRETDPKKKRYNELDAMKCRGWAARMRAGWKPPASAPASNPFGGGDDNISF